MEHELQEFHEPGLMRLRECRTYVDLQLAVEYGQIITESRPFVEQLMAWNILDRNDISTYPSIEPKRRMTKTAVLLHNSASGAIPNPDAFTSLSHFGYDRLPQPICRML